MSSVVYAQRYMRHVCARGRRTAGSKCERCWTWYSYIAYIREIVHRLRTLWAKTQVGIDSYTVSPGWSPPWGHYTPVQPDT